MRNRFNAQLKLLKDELVEMGNLVEGAIQTAVNGMKHTDLNILHKLSEYENKIDRYESKIETLCIKLLLEQQPVAQDLLLVSSALKMITDMERIGDQALDIGELLILLADASKQLELDTIEKMAQETKQMVTKSISAFVEGDIDIAREVIAQDDVVDQLFNQVRNDMIQAIRGTIANGEEAVDYLMIAKYYERIGDRATNIAEWVIYSIEGQHDVL